MLINNAVIQAIADDQAAYNLWFMKNGQEVAWYRLPRSGLTRGQVYPLIRSRGSAFPFDADAVRVNASFATAVNNVSINRGNYVLPTDRSYNAGRDYTLPTDGQEKMIKFGGGGIALLIFIGLGIAAYAAARKRP